MRLKIFLQFFVCIFVLFLPGNAIAWGEKGHRIVGAVALSHLDSTALREVNEILESAPDSTIGTACNWPDEVRETEQWEWSASMHYVNIPRHADHYDRSRDCKDGLCVTSAIIKYANELSRNDLDLEQRWQAFAWLCHLVGDLHQPLHTGYKDDLGGNTLQVEYLGQPYNLHQFWDRAVIQAYLENDAQWVKPLSQSAWSKPPGKWNPAETISWTDESHALVAASSYPPGRVIHQDFADQSWKLICEQWQKASIRLAQILNATLGEGKIVLD